MGVINAMNVSHIPAYELIKETTLGDIHSKGYLLCHKKSGARVMLIENDDENKVFNIAFRTPPADSTGVAHILEHSVLCGSKHFPLKDPFVELVKGSLNTFLNAMTFPDKTMYPVASCNDQDFQNLMHVYLDAVFFPNIYEKEEIFRQEGWSYQIEAADQPLTYNGVVYNEMKGVFSSSDELLEREAMNVLFPDTPYGVESGGDPQCIPDLTYEEFLNFHRKYYHPSNSYIYLYGNMDMEEKLQFIDREYLSAFDAKEIHSEIPLQKAFEKRKDVEFFYPVLENESLSDNTYLSFHTVIGNSLDTELSVAFQVLDYALLSAPGAPLKQALLDAGIGKDVYGSYDDGIYQPTFTLVAKNANKEDKEKFRQVIDEALEKIVREGIPPKSLEAGINFMEFRFREADYSSYPKGLMYGLDVFGSWLYDDNMPFNEVMLLDIFDKLKKEVQTGYFEKLVQTWLIDNSHAVYMTLSPKRGMTAEKDRQTEEKLQNYKESLSEEEIALLVKKTAELKAYQEAEEKEEALACIPMLKREDIKREVGNIDNEERFVRDALLVYHPVETNGIAYLNLYFDFRKIPAELLPYVGILKSVLGYVDTQHYTYGELFNEINANTGGISCGTEFFQKKTGEAMAYFGIRAKALNGRLDFVFDMIHEILFTSSLEDDKRLYEIIARLKSRLQDGIPSAGHSSAVQRALSYHSALAWMQEQTSGIAYYQFLEKLETEFDSRKEKLKEKLQELMSLLFFRENLMVSFTGDEETCKKIEAQMERLQEALPHREENQMSKSVQYCPNSNEGFMTAGQVQYVAQVGNFAKDGMQYTGALSIFKLILSYDYLWNHIRVKGGAYGCMSGFKRNGESYFVSYRDPNLKNTLDVYAGIPQYLEEFQADERAMTKYIIGTVSGLDVPKTPKMQGQFSMAAYLMGITKEELQEERNQILDAQAEDIRALAPLVRAILQDGDICVIGGEEAIEKNKELFHETKHLIGQEDA